MRYRQGRFCAFSSLVVVSCCSLSLPTIAEAQPLEIVVTPYYTPTALGRSGSSVSVITSEEIERQPTESVAQLLRTVPGVTVTETGGVGGQTLVSLRGTEAQHTLVLIDGVRVNDPASARDQFDFSQFTITDIERIEVLRGPQSALYGSDAIGGVINIITRKPSGRPELKASVEGGSYGTRRFNLSGGTAAGDLSLYTSGTYFETDGFSRTGDRDNGEADGVTKFAGTMRGAFDPGGGVKFEFGADGYNLDSEVDAGRDLDLKGYHSDRGLFSGFAKFSFPTFDGRVNNSVNFFIANTSREYIEPDRTFNYEGQNLGVEAQKQIGLGNAGSLLAGSRFETQTATGTRSDLDDPTFDNDITLYAGYLLYQLPIGDRLDLTFAGRHDGEIDGDGFTTGRATAFYALPEIEAAVRGSIGTGAKRPTAFQLGYNPDLEPETSVGGDLGVEKMLFDGRFSVATTGFWNRIDDMIDWDPTVPPFGNYANIDEVQTSGVEVTAKAMLVPGALDATATYTYLDARNLTTDTQLARRPQNAGSLTLVYTGIPRFEAALTATYVGERYNDDARTEKLDPYTRVDLSANYRVDDNLTIYGRVENLFDTTYEDVKGYNSAGLSAYAGLKWKN
ncbi:TonB-dependent receptor plug domain-containing protein [Bauldia sp.]|uniref:TonB-dependent receptor plug domain-containing protein n=1 Tax=Bauldia sp. TaxID=2575872 RepID=UPI003BAACC30